MLELSTDLDRSRTTFLQLATMAASAYHQFVFDSPDQGAAFDAHLFEHGAAEFGPPAGRTALLEDECVGMAAYLSGPDLLRQRLRAARLVAKAPDSLLPPAAMRRLRLAGSVAVPGRPDEMLLTRIAVDPASRGRGIGRFLLDAFIADSRSAGVATCGLAVADDNASAIGLYRSAGFAEQDLLTATDPDGSRTLRYLYMRLALD